MKEEKKKASLDGDYPGLSVLSYWIGYLEQALAILSEPLLIGCSALAVIDFITGGVLLALPVLMYLWASSLAIAVTACFIVTWRRAIRAFSQNRYIACFFLVVLGLILGVVDWTAVATQSLQQAMHLGFAQALASLGFDVFMITNIRAAVAIAMAVVVAISNHTAVTTAQAPKRRLLLFDKMLDKVAPVVSDVTPKSDTHLTPETPVTSDSVREPVAAIDVTSDSGRYDTDPMVSVPTLHVVGQMTGKSVRKKTGKRVRNVRHSARSQVSDYLSDHPQAGPSEIAQHTGLSRQHVTSVLKTIRQEEAV